MGFNDSYAEQAVGFAGMLADSSDHTIQSFVNDEASAEIAFGMGVVQGTSRTVVADGGADGAGSPDGCLLPVDANSVPMGIAVHSHAYDKYTELGTTGIKPDAMVSVMKRGRVLIAVEDAVTKGAQLYLRYTANGAGKVVGNWRSDADTAKALLVKGVVADGTTTGAGLVPVLVDMTIR